MPESGGFCDGEYHAEAGAARIPEVAHVDSGKVRRTPRLAAVDADGRRRRGGGGAPGGPLLDAPAGTDARVPRARRVVRAGGDRRHPPACATDLALAHPAGDPCDRRADVPGAGPLPPGLCGRWRAGLVVVVAPARSQAGLQPVDVRAGGGARCGDVHRDHGIHERSHRTPGLAGSPGGGPGDRPALGSRGDGCDQPDGGQGRPVL